MNVAVAELTSVLEAFVAIGWLLLERVVAPLLLPEMVLLDGPIIRSVVELAPVLEPASIFRLVLPALPEAMSIVPPDVMAPLVLEVLLTLIEALIDEALVLKVFSMLMLELIEFVSGVVLTCPAADWMSPALIKFAVTTLTLPSVAAI